MNVRDLIPWTRGDREPGRIYRSESLSPMISLHREMNRLFDDVFRGFDEPRAGGRRSDWPTMEVEESDKEYRVTAELPGMEERDIEILLQDGVLSIRGEKKVENESRNRTFSERFYGRFERQLSFDRAVDEEHVNATFRNGVLAVTVPKTAQVVERSKRIAINAPAAKSH
ncbi:MAG TPA: Hsp20/alpha crystallin family protein [Steroidobacteraceae bacterium]|nr:Hsp20/alpha crystallin family protein [Steroidobacteraceae bacterium]